MIFSIPLLGALAALFTTLLALPASPNSLENGVTGDVYYPPRLLVYVQTFHDVNGSRLSLLPLLNENTGTTHVVLAALHINKDPLNINLNDNNPNSSYYDDVWSEVKQLQNAGIKVLVMMGGAAPGSYPRLCGTAVPTVIVGHVKYFFKLTHAEAAYQNENYYIPLRNTLRYHNIDGIDLDIEEEVDITCALALLNRLAADFGPAFILTMAPVASSMIPKGPGLSGFNYIDLDKRAIDTTGLRRNGRLVDWYNAQFYNGWGDASTQTFYDAVLKRGGWSSDRVVMGVLCNKHDGGSGFVGLKTLQSVILQLRSNYGNDFGCIVGWEYWDAGGTDGLEYPYQWMQAVGDSVFARRGLPPQNLTGDVPLPYPPAPYQEGTDVLVQEGVGYFEAVKALNRTKGDLQGAKRRLGLPPGE